MKTEKSGSPKWQLFKNILTYTIICLGGIIMLMPFVWMVSTAFKTGAANMVLPPQFIPKEP
ncbi:carbohydrate ABC transporter permease, partial [Listeria monocytogenes]|nr:carbohydrate ABC transporter permease [Listeria monocytogenes]EJP6582518.1 carbohydrate ABC transporter permease [Listeria monocytogenes]